MGCAAAWAAACSCPKQRWPRCRALWGAAPAPGRGGACSIMSAASRHMRHMPRLTPCALGRRPGGSAANVARGLASLADEGAREVAFVGRVGDDDAGRSAPSLLPRPPALATLLALLLVVGAPYRCQHQTVANRTMLPGSTLRRCGRPTCARASACRAAAPRLRPACAWCATPRRPV